MKGIDVYCPWNCSSKNSPLSKLPLAAPVATLWPSQIDVHAEVQLWGLVARLCYSLRPLVATHHRIGDESSPYTNLLKSFKTVQEVSAPRTTIFTLRFNFDTRAYFVTATKLDGYIICIKLVLRFIWTVVTYAGAYNGWQVYIVWQLLKGITIGKLWGSISQISSKDLRYICQWPFLFPICYLAINKLITLQAIYTIQNV